MMRKKQLSEFKKKETKIERRNQKEFKSNKYICTVYTKEIRAKICVENNILQHNNNNKRYTITVMYQNDRTHWDFLVNKKEEFCCFSILMVIISTD